MHGPSAGGGAPPCPLCRKPFTIDELIRLIPPALPVSTADAEASGSGGSGGDDESGAGSGGGDVMAGASGDTKDKGLAAAVVEVSGGGGGGGSTSAAITTTPIPAAAAAIVAVNGAVVRFSAAATPAEFGRLLLPRGEDPAQYRSGSFPALSMDGGYFLAHCHRAAMRRSPKINALVGARSSIRPRSCKPTERRFNRVIRSAPGFVAFREIDPMKSCVHFHCFRSRFQSYWTNYTRCICELSIQFAQDICLQRWLLLNIIRSVLACVNELFASAFQPRSMANTLNECYKQR